MGTTTATGLPLNWGGPDGHAVRWKVDLPGTAAGNDLDQNQSSPIVSHGRVFVTLSYWPGKQDASRYPEHHVVCYRAADGQKLWDAQVQPGPWLLSDLRGGYSAPTPTADGSRINVVFGSAVIAALNYDGRPVWRKEISPHKFDVALGASPVLFGETVLLQCDELDRQSRLSAFDRTTGDLKWEKLRPEVGFAHSTPVIAQIGGKTELLTAASNALQGLDPSNGNILWTCAAQGDAASPVLGPGLVYLDSGRGGTGVAIDPNGMGDLSATGKKWTSRRIPEGLSSAVSSGEYLYRLHQPGVLDCMRWSTGETVYSERVMGANTSASPIATADGRIYLASSGRSFVVAAGPQFRVLGTGDLSDDSPATPAVSEGRLYFKGRKKLYCVGER